MYEDMGMGDDNPSDVRELLTGLGASATTVIMATRYVFMTPLTTDPDMQGVQAIIKLLQRGLTKAGLPVDDDGVLGAKTATALNKVSPPFNSYAGKPWLRLLNDVSAAMRSGKFKRKTPAEAAAASTAPIPPPPPPRSLLGSPLVVGALALGGIMLVMGGKKKRSGPRRGGRR